MRAATDSSIRDQAGGPVVTDTFLETAQCEALLDELRFAWWQPSTVVECDDGRALVCLESGCRVSESAQQAWFPHAVPTLLDRIEERLNHLRGIEPGNLEPWQAVRYRVGGRFDLHHDGGVFANEPAGERNTTILLYLNTPEAGGGTHFPELELIVAARAGRLVTWDNLTVDGSPDPRVRHRALPVRAGTKTILTTWEREHPTKGPLPSSDQGTHPLAGRGGPLPHRGRRSPAPTPRWKDTHDQ